MESYVISISLGTGCYRHIQISANATLFRLHQAILRAFAFDDDHEHAFFMDNRVWSPADAYFSCKIEPGDHLTKKYTLKKLQLEKGQKFMYLFDLGDEWTFQCKVLRELDEKTDIPGVIRSVGEAPEQYPDWEESEDDEDPDSITQEDIEKLYEQISFSQEEVDCIREYLSAAANLYGLLSLDELHMIYNSQNPKVGLQDFLIACGLLSLKDDSDFVVINSGDDDQPPEELLKSCEVASEYLFVEDPERDIPALRRGQKGKPLKILPKAEFLRFADTTYFPETPQRSAMIHYLRRLAPSLTMRAEDYCDCIQSVIVIDAPLQEVLHILKEDGLTRNHNWDLEEFAMLYQELNNHTHKHVNRGNTPDELAAIYSGGQKPVPGNALNGQLSLFEQAESAPD